MKLPDNYKGKTFADISKEIQEKYKDRHDAISKKGMMAELKALKEAQEKVRFDKQVEDTVGSIKKMQTGSFVNDSSYVNSPYGLMQQKEFDQNVPYLLDQPSWSPIQDNSGKRVFPSQFLGVTEGFQDNSIMGTNELPWYKLYGLGLEDNTSYLNALGLNNYFGETKQISPWGSLKSNAPDVVVGGGNNKLLPPGLIGPENIGVENIPNIEVPINNTTKTNTPTKTNIPTLDLQSIGLNLANGVNAAPTELMSNPNQPFGDPNNSVGITNDGPTSTAPTGGGNLNLGKYAGLAMNLASLMGMDKPEDIYDTLSARGIDTRMDTPDLVAPEQTYYSKIDFAPIQRAIEQQAANFKSNNLNASNGNAGRFLSNELLSDVNTKRAVANARMQEQIQNNQIAGMNAQERAKYVEALNQQELARQGTDQYNIGLGLQLEDINARNLGAYNTAKSQAKNMIASNFQDMQKEKMLSDAVTNALGYPPSGNYQVDPNQWANFMQNISQFLGK